MKHIKKYKSGVGFVLIVMVMGSSHISLANTFENLESSWYVGGGLGMSRLQPDGHDNWGVSDENDTSKKVYAGVNIARDFGLEAFWNDFGEATVASKTSTAEAKVKYSGYGANVVYHVPSYVGGLHPIAKIGIAKLDTEGEGVTVNQKNSVSVMAGVGAEYELEQGFRIRAEYEYFDKDIDQISIGLNWRPDISQGSGSSQVVARQEPVRIVNTPRPVVRPVAVAPKRVIRKAPPPKPIVRTVVKRVPVYIEKPAPKPIVRTIIKQAPPVVQRVEIMRPAPVVRLAPPKTIHKTLAGGSHFASNSASLTYEGTAALERLAGDLQRDNVVIHNIQISGHTDSVGDSSSNQRLSEQRAETVANYLATRGLNRGTMTVLGRGESQPVASNDNASGRAKNRRVNIVVKGSQTLRQ